MFRVQIPIFIFEKSNGFKFSIETLLELPTFDLETETLSFYGTVQILYEYFIILNK